MRLILFQQQAGYICQRRGLASDECHVIGWGGGPAWWWVGMEGGGVHRDNKSETCMTPEGRNITTLLGANKCAEHTS